VFVAEPNAELNLPIEAIQMLYGLRPAETRVFELIAAGLSAPRIAATLGVSPNTVKTHTARLFDKLGVHSRAELLRFARESSLGRQ
jgi:DNA-binding CsgD family transcriptional regulator